MRARKLDRAATSNRSAAKERNMKASFVRRLTLFSFCSFVKRALKRAVVQFEICFARLPKVRQLGGFGERYVWEHEVCGAAECGRSRQSIDSDSRGSCHFH